MALTFFWRAENNTTLDATHDFTAGDNTATGAGTVSFNASAARVGSYGIWTQATGDVYTFAGASIFSHTEGAAALSFQRVLGTGASSLMRIYGTTSANNQIAIEWGSNNLTVRHRNQSTGENRTAVLDDGEAASSTGVWQAVVIRWNTTADLLRIELYDSSGTLLDSADATLSMTPASDTFTIEIGNASSATDWYIDNVFIADDYDEPLEDFLDITSYTEYGSSSSGIVRQMLMNH